MIFVGFLGLWIPVVAPILTFIVPTIEFIGGVGWVTFIINGIVKLICDFFDPDDLIYTIYPKPYPNMAN